MTSTSSAGAPDLSSASVSQSTRTTSKDVEKEIEQLRSDVSSLTQTLKDYGTGKYAEYNSQARGKRDELTAQWEEKEEEIKARVRANPIQAVGIAAGVGFLIGVIWRS